MQIPWIHSTELPKPEREDQQCLVWNKWQIPNGDERFGAELLTVRHQDAIWEQTAGLYWCYYDEGRFEPFKGTIEAYLLVQAPVRPVVAATNRRAVYRENGARCIVEVLSDVTEPRDGKSWRTVKLKLVEIKKSSPFFGPLEVGEEWTSKVQAGFEAYSWSLDYLQEGQIV